MALQEQLAKDLTAAMREKDELRKSVLRMVKAAIQNRAIEVKRELTDEEVADLIRKEIKKRRDAIDAIPEGKRETYQDFIQQQNLEIGLLSSYLPRQLSEEEVEKIVVETLREHNLTSKRQMGEAMRLVMDRLKGLAEGKLVNQVVQRHLT